MYLNMVKINAQKIGITQLFDKKGNIVVATILHIPTNIVTSLKTLQNDGYEAVVIGSKAIKKLNKPGAGKLHKANIKEKINIFFESPLFEKATIGDKIDINSFKINDDVTVIGKSKGKGFAGTVKRHGFHTGPKTHGSNNYRQPGSIGSAYPERVVKGKKMAGRMGYDQITVKGLKIVDISPENQTIALNGPIPGPRNGFVKIIKANI